MSAATVVTRDEDVLQELEDAGGFILFHQVSDEAAFQAAWERVAIESDHSLDGYVHPAARKTQDGLGYFIPHQDER